MLCVLYLAFIIARKDTFSTKFWILSPRTSINNLLMLFATSVFVPCVMMLYLKRFTN